MNATSFSSSYFGGFHTLANYKANDAKTNALALLKVVSYFTLIIPLGFLVAASLTSLRERVQQHPPSPQVDRIDEVAIPIFAIPKSPKEPPKEEDSQEIPLSSLASLPPIESPEGPFIAEDPLFSALPSPAPFPDAPIQVPGSKVVHEYTGDLTPSQKEGLKTNATVPLRLSFPNSAIEVTIRQQDLFKSGAQVIVNAANSHLGGGSGIDGAIHRQGGAAYKKAHQSLREAYKSHYVLGHAAMIASGALKEKYQIDSVIVVAGPQGEASSQKENELYSCYYNSLVLASAQNKASIAFPSISTGIFGFPKDRAAAISLKALQDFIHDYPATSLKKISIHFLPTEPVSNIETYQRAAT